MLKLLLSAQMHVPESCISKQNIVTFVYKLQLLCAVFLIIFHFLSVLLDSSVFLALTCTTNNVALPVKLDLISRQEQEVMLIDFLI